MADKKRKAPAPQRSVLPRILSAEEAAFEQANMIGDKMSFAASEAYKLLRTNLLFSFSGDEDCRIIGMTSSFQGEGKSLTSLNLAYTLAEARKKILLIEADMRLPVMSRRLRLTFAPGLSNLLVGLNTVSDAIQPYSVSMSDGSSVGFDVVTAGTIPPNPSELLGSPRMKSLLATLRSRYEYIILDLPPVTAVTDALVVSQLADGMIVVVRGNHAIRDALAETIRQLQLVNSRILGFVFNGATGSGSGYYYKKRGRGYRGYYKNSYYYDAGSRGRVK